jgi:tetratricopeptide (TPR) repeat protein
MQERSRLFIPVVLFLAVFSIYLRTLNPVFHSDDSPETIACSYTLGIQHPPGYPLPTLTGKIFSMIPAGNIGFRVNIQSAVFGALSCVVIYFILAGTLAVKAGPSAAVLISSLSAALSAAFSFTIWNQSLSAKGGIYALNGLLLLLVMLSLFKWERSGRIKYFYMALFLYGISLGNHWESMAVAFPALLTFVVLVFTKDGLYKTITPRMVLTIICAGATGLTFYAYLVIRARGGAFLNWGDPENLKQLLWVITRAEYSATEKAADLTVIIKQVARAAGLIFTEFTWAGFLIALSGISGFLKNGRTRRLIMFCVLTVSVIGALAFYFNLKDDLIWVMDVFMMPVYMMSAVFIGSGFYGLMQMFKGNKLLMPAVFAASIALPVYLLAVNFSRADQSGYYYGYDYGLNMIKSMDKPGVAMLEGDYAVMPQMYFKYIEKKGNFCPVTTIFLQVPWSIKNLKNECPQLNITASENDPVSDKIKKIIEANYTSRDIYVSVFRKSFQDFYPQANAMLVPYGAVMKMTSDKTGTLKQAEAKLKIISYRGLLGGGAFMDTSTRLGESNYSSLFMETGDAYASMDRNETGFYYLQRALALSTDRTKPIALTHLGVLYSKTEVFDKALACFEESVRLNPESFEAMSDMAGIYNNRKDYDRAIDICEKAIKVNPSFPEVYNNMAIAYYNKGNTQTAVDMLEKAVLLNPASETAKKNLLIIKGEKR